MYISARMYTIENAVFGLIKKQDHIESNCDTGVCVCVCFSVFVGPKLEFSLTAWGPAISVRTET